MASTFEKQNGRKLLIRGKAIGDIFKAEWTQFKPPTSTRQSVRQPKKVSYKYKYLQRICIILVYLCIHEIIYI